MLKTWDLRVHSLWFGIGIFSNKDLRRYWSLFPWQLQPKLYFMSTFVVSIKQELRGNNTIQSIWEMICGNNESILPAIGFKIC